MFRYTDLNVSETVVVQENPSKDLPINATQLTALEGGQGVDLGNGSTPYPSVAGTSGLAATLASDEV